MTTAGLAGRDAGDLVKADCRFQITDDRLPIPDNAAFGERPDLTYVGGSSSMPKRFAWDFMMSRSSSAIAGSRLAASS